MIDSERLKILKEKRLSKKISLEEASSQTHISINTLRKIEEGQTKGLHPAYLKGFVKIYAKFLGLDPKTILGESIIQPRLPSYPLKSEKKRLGLTILKKAHYYPKFLKVAKLLVLLLGALLVIFSLKALFIQIHKSSSKKTKKSAVSSVKKNTPIPRQPPKKMKGINIVVRARKNVYLDVKSDGKSVFEKILLGGFEEKFKANKEIRLRAGDGQAIELVEVNGKYWGPLSREPKIVEIKITSKGVEIVQ